MLSEQYVASIGATFAKPNTAVPKDAGIFLHEFQPLAGQRHIFKKSNTPPNCLAVSASHIFAAQGEKAVVHVYNREKGNQEAIIPCQERIHAIALAANDTVLVLGTESGRILLWETCAGRLVSAPVSHLQRVTAIAVESGSNFLLTGSADSNVNVWSLPHLLSYSSSVESRSPVYSLSSHRNAVTSIAIGYSSSFANIAVSASSDNTAIVWDYHSGEMLRTYLLVDTPLSVCLDPAERAFYASYGDGSVQIVDFYATPQKSHAVDTLRSPNPSSVSSVVEPPASSRWQSSTETLNLGAALSLGLSWDSTTLISGHANGKIAAWDTAQGRFKSIISTLSGPVTNIQMLSPTGFPNPITPKTKIHAVIKPRPEMLGKGNSSGEIPTTYNVKTQFVRNLPTSHISHSETSSQSYSNTPSFTESLNHPSFPPSLIESGLAELAAWSSKPSITDSKPTEADFVSMSNDKSPAVPIMTEAERIQDLQSRLDALQRVQKVTFKQLAELRKDRDSWRAKEERQRAVTVGEVSRKGAATKKRVTESEKEEDDDDMDVDQSEGEGSEVDIDAKLRHMKNSDEEWSEEEQVKRRDSPGTRKLKSRPSRAKKDF